MKSIVVTGGKGGTGKSFVATNLAFSLAKNYRVALVDLDVENPNDHILLGIEKLENREEIKLFYPVIDYNRCTSCSRCAEACRVGAIMSIKGRPFVIPRLCNGCKACYYACRYGAIVEGWRIVGYSYVTKTSAWGRELVLVTGSLIEGEEHVSPVIVATIKRFESLNKEFDFVIMDVGAGTGSKIAHPIRLADTVIAVAEPTPLSLHDLELVLKVVSRYRKKLVGVLNKVGLGYEEQIKKLFIDYGAEDVIEIPLSRDAVDSYTMAMPIEVYRPTSPVFKAIEKLIHITIHG